MSTLRFEDFDIAARAIRGLLREVPPSIDSLVCNMSQVEQVDIVARSLRVSHLIRGSVFCERWQFWLMMSDFSIKVVSFTPEDVERLKNEV